jgi:vacuolar-type H+-ATPase subunit I/STV1
MRTKKKESKMKTPIQEILEELEQEENRLQNLRGEISSLASRIQDDEKWEDYVELEEALYGIVDSIEKVYVLLQEYKGVE